MIVQHVVAELTKSLSPLNAFLALAIYPAAVLLGFSFNLTEARWGSSLARRGLPFGEPMPQELRDKADAMRRYLSFLVDALILCFVAILSYRIPVSSSEIGLRCVNWKRNTIIGIAAGTALIVVMGLMLRRVPIDPGHDFTYRVRKGSLLLWVFIFVSSAFSEELWIAFCLVVLTSTKNSAAISVAMTTIVFAAMHYSYRLWGAVAVGAKEVISAVLFLHFGSVIVTFFYHFVANLGSLYWNRYWRATTRGRVSS
jgi:Type II CAAX prenyl endopeptidase Rce1-like